MNKKFVIMAFCFFFSAIHAFSFKNYIRLKKKDTFLIYTKESKHIGKNIGYGKVLHLSNTYLHLYFEMPMAFGQKNTGHLKIRFKRESKRNYKMTVQAYDQLFAQFNETVLANKFIADNNILTFNLKNNRKIFFQMKQKTTALTQIVTNYGSIFLKKRTR